MIGYKYEKLLKETVKPITNNEHIKELQRILVQTCLDFINKYGLTDIYAVRFCTDNLAYSAKSGEWQPLTDSYIKVEGVRYQNHRRKNGDVFKIPYRYNIGEHM